MGNPEDESAARRDEAPGIGIMDILFSIARRIILYAGSEIPGVPASEIKARSFPLPR